MCQGTTAAAITADEAVYSAANSGDFTGADRWNAEGLQPGFIL